MVTARHLIVPGAQKSGTTSLYSYLAGHPELQSSRSKEPDYFSNEQTMSQRAYDEFFPDANGTATTRFEASTSYLYHPDVPERIKAHLGDDVKFLIILRNPIDRAISAYWHLNKKFEDERELGDVFDVPPEKQKALLTETKNIKQAEKIGRIDPSRCRTKYENPYWPFHYLKNSFYSDHLSRYESLFPSDRIKVVLLEELGDNPPKTLSRIKSFLDLESDFNLKSQNQHNETRVPKRDAFYSVFHYYLKPIVKHLFGKPTWLTRLYTNFTYQEKPDCPLSIRRTLSKLFKEEASKLNSDYELPTDRYWNLSNFE